MTEEEKNDKLEKKCFDFLIFFFNLIIFSGFDSNLAFFCCSFSLVFVY